MFKWYFFKVVVNFIIGRNHNRALFVILVLQRKRFENTPASSHRGETFFNAIIVTLVSFTAYLYSKYHFISHHRTHTSVLSFFCDSDLCLNDKICLKNYYITHTGEGGSTQYTVYDDYFINRSDLKPHHQMHTGEKPFKFSCL